MQNEWDMHFAEGGHQALTLLQQRSFDVVVSDLLMPGIDGISLLNAVMKKYPNAIRIVLSGASDKEIKLKSVAASHQFLAKPVDVQQLKSVIMRALALRDLLNSQTLQGLVAKVNSLPTLSAFYLELVREIQSPDSKLSTVGKIITKDAGMTAKILQLVNSACFGLRTRVSSTEHAARLLGLETIKALALTYDVFSGFKAMDLKGLPLREFMEHSLKVGSFARLIIKNENPEQSLVNDAFISGVLHDIGKIVLAKNFPKHYSNMQERAKYEINPVWKLEHDTFGASHAEVGAYLLGLWRLPNPVIEALAFHHQPMLCSHKILGPLTAVHVANIIAREKPGEQGVIHKLRAKQIDADYLSMLGVDAKLQSWHEICAEAEQKSPDLI